MMTVAALACLAGSVLLAAPLPQDPLPAPAAAAQATPATPTGARRAVIAPEGNLDTLTLVRSSYAKAVVRFGASDAGGGLIVVEPGDRIGRTAATVRAVAPDRLVLDDVTRDADGRPRRAQIVFQEGHAGGRRYMRDPGMDAPAGVRPEVLGPDGKPVTVKKPGKGL
jgi:hypothetical protein